MIDIRVGKSVRRVILLTRDKSGVVTPATLYRKKQRKKKKGSPGLKQIGKALQTSGKAQQAFTDTLMKRHKRSNRKRKDGWLRDLGQNVFKASGKSYRKMMKDSGM